MTDIVGKFIDGREQIFAAFGVSGTLTRITKGTFNRVTGKPTTPDVQQQLTVEVKLGKRKVKDDNGVETVIQTATCREKMEQGDLLSVAGLSLRVTAVTPKTIKGVVLTFRP
ncbi:hypothetical protein [Sphingobium baderi]|uniref:Uncharacterized protein n=1 Tax=Sphingobium baderi TaxID=1332080 RepID=A0A0S3F2E6_9SPHN|nr:hypothetical protein [Sphingobium baderi]ALR21888.1 hypothetical protein ATN00_17920 [Sphingobium baderi]